MDTIPGPLLDRMEVVRLSGYILDEKVQIARQYLEPAAREQMGLTDKQIEVTKDSLVALIRWYCREAGVRNLQKHIERICRKVALKVVQAQQGKQQAEEAARAADAADATPDDTVGGAPVSETPGGALAEGAAGAASSTGADTTGGASPVAQYVVGPEQLAEYVGKSNFTDERIYETNPVSIPGDGRGRRRHGICI